MRVLAQQRTVESDREALITLENKWLRSEHRATELDSILACDFVHPVVTGDLLDKAQHIHFSSTHIPPANLQNHFDGLKVRLYGDVGIVNGLVARLMTKAKKSGERSSRMSLFTATSAGKRSMRKRTK